MPFTSHSRLGVAATLALLVIACSSGTTSSQDEDVTPSEVAGETTDAEGWTDDDVEYQLAVIDAGGYVSHDDPVIGDYAAALDAVEAVCPEDRRSLGDMSVAAIGLLDRELPGHNEDTLSMLRAVAASLDGVDTEMPCDQIFASLIVIMTG